MVASLLGASGSLRLVSPRIPLVEILMITNQVISY